MTCSAFAGSPLLLVDEVVHVAVGKLRFHRCASFADFPSISAGGEKFA